jgi:hypothetical protein
MRFFITFTALFFQCLTPGQSQENLLFEDFNSCNLPAGWEVHSTGNQNMVWYVGDAVQNNDNNGQSMNGSCFLFIDDDATGNQTPAYVLDFISPAFDASQYPTLELSVDVHYRDWNEADEHFDILLTDGVTETLIRRYDKYRSTGSNLYEFETLVFDLALVTKSPNARIIFRYNDAGGFNWWAGIDNFSITGKGQGVNVVAESFNGCAKPQGWETQVLTGIDDWKFGVITEGAALGGSNSMDGTCFAYFDDDFIGQSAPFSIVRLVTPWFDGSQYSQFTLEFDAILRYHSEKLAAIVQHVNGQEFIVAESQGSIGGPFFNQYQHIQLDLSPYRSSQMRVIFEYDDGHDWAWWAGLDNVKITGNGVANDICQNARTLLTGQTCVPEGNQNALLDGTQPSCVSKSSGGLWYSWTADFTGTARFSTNARFNDVVEIFSGDCSNPALLLCHNRDEHGFTGETTYFQAEAGTNYLIRVSGQEGGFGQSRGNLCVQLEQVNQAPQLPGNDDCSQATQLTPGTACEAESNLYAGTSALLPRYNLLARHDVWYRFTAPDLPAGAYLEFKSHANFSDIITLYAGSCDQLQETNTNHKGQTLACTGLNVGQDYFIQVSGTFATIEGGLCPELLIKSQDAPPNDHCQDAVALMVGGNCQSGTNLNAGFSGWTPPCVPVVGHDVWYKFQAPVSGSVLLNTGADFPHVLAVWRGSCNALEPVFCRVNPLRCDGFVSFGALNAGETYYLQIASAGHTSASGVITGSFCIQILDGADPAPFEPLVLHVTEKCISDNISRLKVAVNGGLTPYQFSGNPDGEELASGEHYLVVVSDALGCVRALEGVTEDCQAQDCALSGALTALHPTCHNQMNGMLSAMATGGTAPYSYRWSNNATTADIGGLASGDYSATITDALDCELVLTTTLNNPPAINAVSTEIAPPHPGMSDGAIYIDANGGTGSLSFQWLHNGTPFATSEDLSGAPAGDYTLIITDSNGCTATYDFTLTETVGGATIQQEYFTEVFPNPATDKAWLAISFPKVQTLHLSLWDASGRAIQTWTVKNVTEQNIPLELKNLPNGSYQLRVLTEAGMFVETVIKK